MPGKRYQAYSIRFTPDELESLREVAERQHLAISDVIREALAAYRSSRLGIIRTRIDAAGTRFHLEVADGNQNETESENAQSRPPETGTTTTQGAMLAPA